MTTVAFVTYKVNNCERRVGPIALEMATPMAKNLTRNHLVSEVVLEEWALVRATPMHEEKLA